MRDGDCFVIARFLASPAARARWDGPAKKPSSTNALRSSLRGFFHYLHEGGMIRTDPTRLVRRALASAPPPRALSQSDQDRLSAAMATASSPAARRDAALFSLMLRSGIRVGSALALDIEDVDLDDGSLRLRSAKGGRHERVILSAKARDELREWIGGRISGPLFPSRDGERLSRRHVHRRFTAWLARAGIMRSASPHSLRHSFATDFYRRTGDLLLTQAALHHRSVASTLVYARIDEQRLRAALESSDQSGDSNRQRSA